MSLPTGTRLGVFEIADLLGAGGMGEVYRARDTKLGRDVALKVLPKGFAEDDQHLARFRREATMLAALDHPNIGALYDFQEEDGVHFLVMQLVAGPTMADLIAQGAIPIEEALPMFGQIAEALEAAHEQGIIHRDLKPQNIIVNEDGKVRVLDFGIAKPFQPIASPTDPTRPGAREPRALTAQATTLGTPSYMSPEQARGKPVDKRADVWAFGCSLYEALTGDRPFLADNLSDILVKVLEHEPDWHALPSETPPSVQSLLRRCLEKEPGRRLRDMGDIAISLEDAASELRGLSRPMDPVAPGPPETVDEARPRLTGLIKGAIASAAVSLVVLAVLVGMRLFREESVPQSIAGPAAQAIRGIVVLPFKNLSDDPGQEFFVDGMTDALTAELGKIKALKVISRTSAMRYRGLEKEASEVAQELAVDAVIEGSVYRKDDDVRIMAQLIDGRTNTNLWSDTYAGTVTNIFHLQGEVTLAIAREIEVVVTPEEEARIASTRMVNPEAYEAFLKAEFAFKRYTSEGFNAAMAYGERAIEIDPDYAEVYAAGSLASMSSFLRGLASPGRSLPRARVWASQALRLDDNLALAHSAVGWIALGYDWDWRKAEESFERALELNPNDATAYVGLAWHSAVSGDYDDALEMMEIATRLDPLWLHYRVSLGDIHGYSGQSGQAIEHFKKALEVDSDYAEGLTSLARVYSVTGMHAEAIACVERAVSVVGRTPGLVVELTRTCALSGRRQEAEALVQELHDMNDGGQYVQANYLASAYAALGDSDEAFKWLERAYERREFVMVLLKSDTVYPELRSDPRFDDLLERMKFPGGSGADATTAP